MRALMWSLKILVFLVLFAFAVKNTEPVTLRFFFDGAWQAPMIVILFAFFAVGAFFGLLAAAPVVLRMRRELAALRRIPPVMAAPQVVQPIPDVAQD